MLVLRWHASSESALGGQAGGAGRGSVPSLLAINGSETLSTARIQPPALVKLTEVSFVRKRELNRP